MADIPLPAVSPAVNAYPQRCVAHNFLMWIDSPEKALLIYKNKSFVCRKTTNTGDCVYFFLQPCRSKNWYFDSDNRIPTSQLFTATRLIFAAITVMISSQAASRTLSSMVPGPYANSKDHDQFVSYTGRH